MAAKSPTATTVHTTFPTTAIIDPNLRALLRVGNFHTLSKVTFRDASTALRGAPHYGGGTWGGCVFDAEKILRVLEAGKKALADQG